MSLEKQIKDYQLWLEAQDFISDAPRYYANEMLLEQIVAIVRTQIDDTAIEEISNLLTDAGRFDA